MEIAKATDGAIDVWSQPGVGTRVTIRWPLAPPSDVLARASTSVRTEGTKAHVLLAEDHPLVREATARGLRRAGYVVHEASDGDQALTLLKDDASYDVLCTDAVMPGSPVTTVIQCFCDRHPGRPIVVMSGYLPEELGAQLRGHAQIRILQKPVTQDQLIQAIELKA